MRQWLALCLLAGASALAGAQPLVLRTVAQEGNAPKFNLGDSQRPGYCPELMQAVQRLDPGISFTGLDQSSSIKRIEGLLGSDQIDVFCGLARTTQRETQMAFIPVPVYVTRHRIAVRADDPLQIHQLEALRELTADTPVLVNRGSLYEEVLVKLGGVPIDNSLSDPPTSLRKLINKRGRAYYYSELELQYYINAGGLGDKLRLLPKVFREDRPLFAVSQSLAPASVARLRKALERLSADGTIQRIVAGYDSF